MMPVQVTRSAEWRRIDVLPTRSPESAASPEFTAALSRRLRLPGSTAELFPVQAASLYEAVRCRGLYAPLPCGAGKTLVTYLLPCMFTRAWPAVEWRAVLMAPAKLVKRKGKKPSKTELEFEALAKDWGAVPQWTPDRWVSYESLGRTDGKDLLEQLTPNLLVLDEAHKCKAGSAAVTKRIKRYLKLHPNTIVIALTGTPIKRSLRDFAHILNWCLRDGSPLPTNWSDLEIWSECIDEFRAGDLDMFRSRPNPGALLDWATQREIDTLSPIEAARTAVGRRIRRTYGVVTLPPGDETCSADLLIEVSEVKQPEIIQSALNTLHTLWELPNGQLLAEGCEIYRHARELALGYYYVWAETPPTDWLEARRNWNSFVRAKLVRSRKYDSPDEIAKAYPNSPERLAWLAVRDSYDPKTVPVWLDTSLVQKATEWLKLGGTVWTDSTAHGECLHSMSGVPYFRDQGRDQGGQLITEYTGPNAICSADSIGEGFNLQRFNRALLVSCPPNNLQLEQILSRHHRRGQTADEVKFELWLGCKQHAADWEYCQRDVNLLHGLFSGRPKLTIARIVEQ